MAQVLWYISVRLGSCQTLLATNFNILIISVDPERMGQWVKKANRVIQWKNYCLDAESMASNLWTQRAAVMLNSYVPPVVQAGRVPHSYSINEFCSFYFRKSWVRGFKALLTLGRCMDTTRNRVWLGCKFCRRQLHFCDLKVNRISHCNIVSLHFR